MDVLIQALQQGLTPAIIIAIYLIIVKIIDNKKENIQTKLNTELVQSITNISNFITEATKNVVNKDKNKCNSAITDSMNKAIYEIMKYFVNTLVNNHIDINKDNILNNIHDLCNAQFYYVYNVLSLYEFKGTRVSEFLKKDWMEEIENIIIKIMYSDKLSREEKILSFQTKLNTKFESYIVYITNKYQEN